ncbi:Meiotically up-regulated protein 87 protein [Elsinoe australis]|uniref:Meiotically up-regulated protein 87 protein n=1 Tax=Elsinoe australis TaxID=40998 RepID=A0A2P8A685_9PEZI|nr:Meiotically up-regulated protein 87 protein [Elsinoe australis]
MSLFGGGAGQSKPPSFSFGNTTSSAANTASSAPQTSGLFGSTTNVPSGQSATSGLFGALGAKPANSGAATSNTPSFSLGSLGGGQQQQQNAGTTGGSSLFGGLGGGQQQQNASSSGGSNLFGGLGGGQQQQNTGTTGLGASTAQPAQSSGLFGGLGGGQQQQNNAQTSQPAQSTGLFGGLGGAQQQSQQQSNGLFGRIGQPSASTNQQAADTSAQQPPQQKPEAQVAYFGQLLERGKKRQNGETQSAELPTLQLGLGDISRKLRNLGGQDSATPQRNRLRETQSHYMLSASGVNTAAALRDLSALNADVAARPATASGPALSSFDTDLDGYVDSLYKQSSLNLVEHHLNQARKDFDDFLEEHVQMEWDSQRQRIYEHFGLAKKGDQDPAGFDAAASVGTRGAFGRSSRRSRLGASAAGPGASGMTKSVLGVPSMRGSRAPGFNDVAEKSATANFQPVPEDRLQREKQDRYAEKVKSLNVARLEESVYPLLHQFAEVENQPSPEDTSHFVNCFKALAEIVDEKPGALNFSDAGAIKERHFSKDYLDDAPNSKGAFQLRKRILNGSRAFLEKQFLSNVESAVAKNPREANLGGIPTVTNKIRAYIRLRSARKELGADNVFLQQVGDDYAWVLIFYLLRAGLVDEAWEYVQSQTAFFSKSDRNFIAALGRFAESEDRRIGKSEENIAKDYAGKLNMANDNQVDPYRSACYKIIGRCGLGKRNLEGVNQSMEDWVWLQFALAREVNRVEETAPGVFTLEDVRSVIQEIGQRHFLQGQAEGGGAVGTYFFLQILAGQFESAIAWLYPHNYLTAVHFAVALNYYGLLRVNDFNGSDDLLSYTTRQQPQLSFGHMLGYYTRDFRAASPSAAADYLCLIALNSDVPGDLGSRQLSLCHEALRELVLETREFAQLLGDIRFDGQRIKGAIESRLPLIRITNSSQFLRQITIGAAQIADENGRVTDAVLLYHLAEEYDDVISVCARALSDSIAAEEGDVVARLEPLKPRAADNAQPGTDAAPPNSSLSLTAVTTPHDLAASMLGLYKSNTLLLSKIRPQNRAQIEVLLRISGAKQLYAQRKWVLCLDAIESTGILPTSAEGDVSRIRGRAHAFDALPPLVVRLGGELLVWTIRCVGEQRGVLEGEGWGPERRVQIERLGQVARDCMVFAGMVRYRLGSRVWEALGGEAVIDA